MPWRAALAPMLVALCLCVPKLWQGDLTVDTGWYAAIALQAYRGIETDGVGAWWSLQGAGWNPVAGDDVLAIAYFNKPPLAFWLNGWPLAIFGPETWAARLGSVFAAVLCVGAMSLIAGRCCGPRVGRAAGLVLALTIPFMGLARSFSLDLWLTLFMLLAVAPLLTRADEPSDVRRGGAAGRLSGVIMGVALGAALLTKPVVGLICLPIVATWLLICGRARLLGHVAVAGLVAVGVAALWHVPMAMTFGERFTGQYFGREMADRAVGDRTAAVFNTGAQSPLYYARVLLESYWPWLITTLLAGAALLRRSGWTSAARGRLGDRAWLVFGMIWSLVWLLALSSFADKRPRYLAPLFPIWAWMSALWLCRGGWGAPAWVRGAWRAVMKWAAPVAVVAAIIVSVAPVRLHGSGDAQWSAVFAWIDAHPGDPIYTGGLVGQRAAKLYLATGRWPRPTRDQAGRTISEIPVGAYLLYHGRDGWSPGPGESVVMQSGLLTLTRLDAPPWRPAPITDPGE